MKIFGALSIALLIAVGAIAAVNHLCECTQCECEPARKAVVFDKIEARSLTIKADGGKHSLVLHSWQNGVGIFSHSPHNSHTFSIVHQDGMSPYIGLHDGKSPGCPVAIAMDEAGQPQIQIVVNGKTRLVSLEKLAQFAD